jgi:hypothetical protein
MARPATGTRRCLPRSRGRRDHGTSRDLIGEPALKQQQSPDLGAPREPSNTGREIRSEPNTIRQAAGLRHLLLHPLRFGRDPRCHRRAESLLRPVKYDLGKMVSHRALQHPFLLAVAQVPGCRQAEDLFDELMVEKRRPHLDRRRHAGPIDFREDVVGKKRLEIEILQPGEGIEVLPPVLPKVPMMPGGPSKDR